MHKMAKILDINSFIKFENDINLKLIWITIALPWNLFFVLRIFCFEKEVTKLCLVDELAKITRLFASEGHVILVFCFAVSFFSPSRAGFVLIFTCLSCTFFTSLSTVDVHVF